MPQAGGVQHYGLVSLFRSSLRFISPQRNNLSPKWLIFGRKNTKGFDTLGISIIQTFTVTPSSPQKVFLIIFIGGMSVKVILFSNDD
ncbi:RagB/SusD domain protein [Bacillus sp. FW1]|nr:RagB/SusD domain protein [Bacillus sp. FW1]GFM15265.1 RagB/SusD domain protein [Bacillus sp. FW1]